MKTRIIFLICITASIHVLLAQKLDQAQVPANVVTSLQAKFPNAADVKWEQKKELYKAEFKIGKRGHDVWIDKSGNVTKHKEDFPKSDLPEAIRLVVTKDFAGYTIGDVDKTEEGNKITYLVNLKGTSGDRKVEFAPDGKVASNKPK